MFPSAVSLPVFILATKAVSEVILNGFGLPFTDVLSLFAATSSAIAISSHATGLYPRVEEI